MKIVHLAAVVAGLSLIATGCSGSPVSPTKPPATNSEDVIPGNPDKNGTSIFVGGTDKSQPWLIMRCTPQAGGTFTFTVEGDHLVNAKVRLGADVPEISPEGKLPLFSLSGVKKGERVTFAYRLANGASERVNFNGCTKQ